MISVCALVVAAALVGQPPPSTHAVPQARQQSPPPARPAAGLQPGRAQAYYEFLQGRHLEASGAVDAAIKAYERAATLDPQSAEIPAELAGLYARQNRAAEAIRFAEKALGIDPQNVEAHRVLGMVFSSVAQGENPDAPMDRVSMEYALKAVPHLEAVERAPGVSEPGLSLALGRIYVRTGAFEKALPILTRLNDEFPGAAEVQVLLAEAHAGAGHLDEAVKLLEALVPGEPQFYPALADVYRRQHRWKDAAGAYDQAIARAPRNPDLKRDLALVLLNLGQPADVQRARDLLTSLLKDKSEDTRALYLLSQAQRQMNDLDGAEATARRLIAATPGEVAGGLVLAQILEQRREYQKVVDTLQPLVGQPGGKPAAEAADLAPLLLTLGAAYRELGQYDAAIRSYEDARRLAPDDAAADAGLVQAHLSARRVQQAADLAEAAARRHPGDLRLAQLHADALRQGGQMDRAVSVMREATERHASDPVAHLALAELLASGGRGDEALSVLREAEAKFPKDVSIEFEIGAVLERQKKHTAAEEAFRKVLAEDPLHAPTLNYLGYMLADRGERLEESVKYIQRALAIDPDNGSYLDSLGWAYFKLNKLDLAEATLRRAAGQRLVDSVVQDHYARVLFKLGRYKEAIAAWERALAGDGEQVDRQEIEGKVRAAREKVGRR